MGQDKAALQLPNGMTLLEWTLQRLEPLCEEVLLAAGTSRAPADPRREAEARSRTRIEDGPGRGPAAGILGAAQTRPGRPLLVLACDLPNVPIALLEALLEPSHCDWVVPRRTTGIEPLCALYLPSALTALTRQVARGVFALHRLVQAPGLEVRYLAAELAAYGDSAHIFLNVNTPRDLELYLSGGAATDPRASTHSLQGQMSRRKSKR